MTATLQHQIAQILLHQIAAKKHCLLSAVKHKLHNKVDDRQIVKGTLQIKSQHKQLEILCFLSYVENNEFHTYYEVAYEVQKLLERKKNGAVITELFIEFMCLYTKSLYEMEQIIQVVLDNTRELYKNGLQNQIERKLTLIPPNAIMKDGRMYCEIQPEKFDGMDMDQNLMAKVRQALKLKGIVPDTGKQEQKTEGNKKNIHETKKPLKPTKSKQNSTQLQRINDTKRQQKIQQEKNSIENKTTKIHKPQKKSLPTKKLQIQSESQSEQYYKPGIQIPMFDLKQKMTAPSEMMQLQNQGNYLENKQIKNHNKPQKMEMEINESRQQKMSSNENKYQQQQDSMDLMMNEMNNKFDALRGKKNTNINSNNDKLSISAKSMPAAGKQTTSKLTDFCSKFTEPPAKSQPVKQASLFSFMGKKK